MKLILIQIIILLTMWSIPIMLKMNKKSNMKTLSPFECGFNNFYSKMPLSIQFTMIMFMFLLFDIELSILISSNWKMENLSKYWISTMMIFMMFMAISIIYEMTKKSFKWK